MVVGILALQGGYALHEVKCRLLDIPTRRVREAGDLDRVDGLIIPGGESSTMLKLVTTELWDKLVNFGASHPVWGICAGLILIAGDVQNPRQKCLGLVDATVRRNAYGAQNESFIASIHCHLQSEIATECIFIRAPKIVHVGDDVEVLAAHGKAPVMIEQNQHLATTFHPELTDTLEFHCYFSSKIRTNDCG